MNAPSVLGTRAIALTAAGCASTLIGDDALADHTAFAPGLNKADLTISSRRDDGSSMRCPLR